MSLHADKSVEVETLDNGWILTWEDKTRARPFDHSSAFPRQEPKTRGREIFTTKTALHKRLKELI